MAIRIRVYPNGGGAYGGMNGFGGMYGVNQTQMYQQQLDNERRTSDMRLDYEKRLYQEKLRAVELQSALQYGGAYRPMPVPFGIPFGGFNPAFGAGMGMFGSLGLGGLFGGSFF